MIFFLFFAPRIQWLIVNVPKRLHSKKSSFSLKQDNMNDPTHLAWISPLVVLVSMWLCYCFCDCSTNNKTRQKRIRVDNGGDNCADCEDNYDCYEVDDIGNDNFGGEAGSGGGDGGSCGGSGGGSCGGGD